MSLKDSDTQKHAILIFDAQCLQCKHWIDNSILPTKVKQSSKKDKDCLWSNGNVNCPAKFSFVAKGLNIPDLSGDFVEAWKTGNVQRLIDVLNSIQSLHEVVKQKALSELASSLHLESKKEVKEMRHE